MDRNQSLQQLRDNPEIPVLIIGAGINGIGTFRDLAAQNVPAVLVDRDDFCAGASAASSHMLHGGIRYLENGEFRLVREALTERNLMLRNAPHAAKPMPTTVPIFRWFSGLFNAPLKFVGLMDKPAERGALVIKIGMTVYDIFAAAYRVMPTHSFHFRRKSLDAYPDLNPAIICTGTYYDSWMPSPERICMDLLRDTYDMNPDALALNYVSAAGSDGEKVTLRDELSGETFEVRPRIVVNAAGPWIDFVNRAMNAKTRFIGGTKGSHLIIDNPALYAALQGHEFFFENEDGRIVLLLPYMGKVMAGTTDIRIDDPDEAIISEDEIAYILNMIPKVFPAIRVTREQIVFMFSGVRPLANSESGYTGNVTRDHQIKLIKPSQSGYRFPIFALIGGKWTSYRAFAEQTANRVLSALGVKRRVSTAQMPIGGGKNYPKKAREQEQWLAKLAERYELDAERARLLFERYGTHAENLAAFMAESDDAPLNSLPHYTRREIAYLIQTEQVARLADLPLRRTLIAWLGEVSVEALEELADICAAELGWDMQRREDEINAAIALLNERFGGQLVREDEAVMA